MAASLSLSLSLSEAEGEAEGEAEAEAEAAAAAAAASFWPRLSADEDSLRSVAPKRVIKRKLVGHHRKVTLTIIMAMINHTLIRH